MRYRGLYCIQLMTVRGPCVEGRPRSLWGLGGPWRELLCAGLRLCHLVPAPTRAQGCGLCSVCPGSPPLSLTANPMRCCRHSLHPNLAPRRHLRLVSHGHLKVDAPRLLVSPSPETHTSLVIRQTCSCPVETVPSSPMPASLIGPPMCQLNCWALPPARLQNPGMFKQEQQQPSRLTGPMASAECPTASACCISVSNPAAWSFENDAVPLPLPL